MPYKADFRHEIWSVDIRYIEEHNLGFPEPDLSDQRAGELLPGLLGEQDLCNPKWVGLPGSAFCGPLGLWRSIDAIVSDGGGHISLATRQWMYTAALGDEKRAHRAGGKPGKTMWRRTYTLLGILPYGRIVIIEKLCSQSQVSGESEGGSDAFIDQFR